MRDIAGFFVLTGIILLTLFLAWFGLKSYGLSRPVSNYQTPLVASVLSSTSKDPILWRNEASNLAPLIRATYKGGVWLNSDHLPLIEALNSIEWTNTPLLLFFESTDPRALAELRKIFNEKGRWKKTIFCSRFDGLLEDLRKIEPSWTFCSGEIYLTRLLAFSSLNLQSLLRIDADVVFIHLNNSNLSTKEVNSLVREAKRQNKMVLVGPISEEKARRWEGNKPHGWVVKNEDQKVQ